MWIMNADRSILTDTDTGKRFTVSPKEDAVLLLFEGHVYGRYFAEHEAKDVLSDFYTAILRGDVAYEFPRSLNQDTYERKRDARTKRRGGS